MSNDLDPVRFPWVAVILGTTIWAIFFWAVIWSLPAAGDEPVSLHDLAVEADGTITAPAFTSNDAQTVTCPYCEREEKKQIKRIAAMLAQLKTDEALESNHVCGEGPHEITIETTHDRCNQTKCKLERSWSMKDGNYMENCFTTSMLCIQTHTETWTDWPECKGAKLVSKP